MVIKLLDQQIMLDPRIVSCDEVVKQMHELVATTQMHVDHFQADGVDTGEDVEAFLQKNLHHIQVLEILVKTPGEALREDVNEALAYLHRAIPEVSTLADDFYQGATKSTWNKFQMLLDGLQWLSQLVCKMQNPELVEEWTEYRKISETMVEKLGELGSSLQETDRVLTGDLIQYEILPLLEEINFQLQHTHNRQEQQYGAH